MDVKSAAWFIDLGHENANEALHPTLQRGSSPPPPHRWESMSNRSTVSKMVPAQRLETNTPSPVPSRLRPPSAAAAAPQIRPLHLVAEHANELLHPSRDGLRHPLGEVGALGADDQLLVGAVFVHVVDRAAQNLRATKRKRDRPQGNINHRNEQVR